MRNHCPHDREHALSHLRTPTQSRGCQQCEGVWLPGPVVAEVLGHLALPALRRLPRSRLRCPDDAQALHAVRHRGVEIDVCPGCHGVWLDRGELASVLAAQTAATDDAGSALEDVDVDELIDALFDRADGRPGGAGTARAEHGGQLGDASSAPDAIAPTTTPVFDLEAMEVERPLGAIEPALPLEAVESEGLLDGVGEAIGGVFEFIGDALSAL